MITQPNNWRRVKLGECCKIVSGATPRRNRPEYWNGNIRWVTPKDISKLIGPVLQDSPEKITQTGYENCSTTLLPKGSILFSSRAPIGLVAIAGRPMCTNQGFKSLIPGSSVDSGYLYWCMKHYAHQVAAKGSGTTFKEVSKSIMNDFFIPLPPLEEQKRIAAILDKADEVRRKRQESIRLTDEFLKSVFLDMFGDPVTNPNIDKLPDDWVRCVVADLRASGKWTCIGGPFGSNLTSTDYRVLGVPVIRSSNLSTTDCFVSEDNFVYVSAIKANELVQNMAYPGDVIFTQRGTLGQVGMIRKKSRYERFIISQSQMKLTPDEELVDPIWLVSYFQAPMSQRVIEKRTLSTGVPHINLGILREFPVNLPPIAEQRRYSTLHLEIMNANTQQLETLKSSHNLFNSLLQRAFKGEL